MDNQDARALRLLIIEDSPDDATLLVRQLQRAGYEVDWRRVERLDVLETALREGPGDAVVADYWLPSFNARDALSVVQASGLDLPFIIVSGSVGETAAVETMRAGAHDFFLKGNLTRLGAAIERERLEARVREE